jgi:hypothetical protein
MKISARLQVTQRPVLLASVLACAFVATPVRAEEPATAPAEVAEGTRPPEPTVGSPTVPIGDSGKGARRLGWTLVATGSAIALLGGVTSLVASTSIAARREDLAGRCQVLRTADECSRVEPGAEPLARDDEQMISTWKNVRLGGLVGAGVGVTVLGIGVVRLLTAPPAPRASALRPQIVIGAGGALFGIAGEL